MRRTRRWKSARRRRRASTRVFDPNRNLFTAFSLNVSPDESRLDRLPAADIEKVLGPGSVLTAQPGVSLNAALRERAAAATTAEPPPAPLPICCRC